MNCANQPNHHGRAFRKPLMLGLMTLALCIGTLSGCSTAKPTNNYPKYTIFFRSEIASPNVELNYYKVSSGNKTIKEVEEGPISWVEIIDAMPPVDKLIVEWEDKITHESFRTEADLSNIIKYNLEDAFMAFTIQDNQLEVRLGLPGEIDKTCEKDALANHIDVESVCRKGSNVKVYPTIPKTLKAVHLKD